MAGIRPPGIRLSFAPLDAALIAYDIDLTKFDERINRAIRKGRMNGYLTLVMADEIACDVLGMHPLFVWGNEYEDAAWFDRDPDPTPVAHVIALPKREQSIDVSSIMGHKAPKMSDDERKIAAEETRLRHAIRMAHRYPDSLKWRKEVRDAKANLTATREHLAVAA